MLKNACAGVQVDTSKYGGALCVSVAGHRLTGWAIAVIIVGAAIVAAALLFILCCCCCKGLCCCL